MKHLAIAVILALFVRPAMGEPETPVRLLTYLAAGSSAEETAVGYRIRTPAGLITARRTGYGWRLEPTTGFSGAMLRAHGNGWLVEKDGQTTYYRRTTHGYSVEPGPNLRDDPARPTLEPSGIEALFRRRKR